MVGNGNLRCGSSGDPDSSLDSRQPQVAPSDADLCPEEGSYEVRHRDAQPPTPLVEPRRLEKIPCISREATQGIQYACVDGGSSRYRIPLGAQSLREAEIVS